MSNYGQVAAKVAKEKEEHPERFCSVPRCLWKIVKRDGTKNPCGKHAGTQNALDKFYERLGQSK